MNTYDDMDPATAFLEYVLEILSSCLVPESFTLVPGIFAKLRSMLQAEQADARFLAVCDRAEQLFQQMEAGQQQVPPVQPFTEEYNAPLIEMRDLLLASQQAFADS